MHKGKKFKPCDGCRDATKARGWLGAAVAGAEAPPSSGQSSSDES